MSRWPRFASRNEHTDVTDAEEFEAWAGIYWRWVPRIVRARLFVFGLRAPY